MRTYLPEFRIFEHPGVVYVNAPKNACTTIQAAFLQAELERGMIGPEGNIEAAEDIHHKAPESLYHTRLAKADWRRPYNTVTSIRNPYTRTLSAYLSKVVRKREIWTRQYGSDDVSFEEFLQIIRSEPVYAMEPHWALQTDILMIGKLRYDDILYFESIDRDLSRVVLKYYGISQFDASAGQQHASSANRSIAKYYDDKTAELVREIYHRDFISLGYSFELDDAEKPPTFPEHHEAQNINDLILQAHLMDQTNKRTFFSALNNKMSKLLGMQ